MQRVAAETQKCALLLLCVHRFLHYGGPALHAFGQACGLCDGFEFLVENCDAGEVLAIGEPVNYLLELLRRAVLKVWLNVSGQAVRQYGCPPIQVGAQVASLSTNLVIGGKHRHQSDCQDQRNNESDTEDPHDISEKAFG